MPPATAMRTLARLWIDRSSRLALQEQLARQIRELIQEGELASGDPLPSTRDLANELKVSRNTAVYAYDRLISEGYLESEPRSGVFVSRSIDLSRRRKRPTKKAAVGNPPKLHAPAPFRPCQPDVELFPLLTWNRMRGRALRREGRKILNYQASCVGGFPALRQAIASYLRDHRGVQCDWHQVVVTAGSQQALFLLARLLLGAESQVYVEDPGYVEARLACADTGAHVIPGGVDGEGLRPPDDESAAISLVYTTPSRQFPTGVSLSLPRRLAL
ncbi:MAG TPA: PLP-dependent aminotransferase family protein, partial [Thermoanaerobaculia bacterium]|nr:PLP-dependent aminotransferase family protein [Thermoanaerobaculia bacterium]